MKDILKIKIRINNTKSKAIAKRMCKPKCHFLEKGHIYGESPQESDEVKERLKIFKIQKWKGNGYMNGRD